MMKHTPNQHGFTIVEISVVLIVIGFIMGILFIYIPDARRQARDKERQSDIDTLHGRLEEYYQDKGSYPSTLTAALFPRMDPAVLIAPGGSSIRNDTPVADEYTARQSTNPNATSEQYSYTAYPTSCTTNCTGYILKSYIESPSTEFPNPYVQGGLNNN